MTVLVLDATVVGQACNPLASAGEFHEWFQFAVVRADAVVPAAADFEVRRELVRSHKVLSIARLDRLLEVLRYEEMNAERWHIASRLWAEARNRGRPTADSNALDIDVLVAATAVSLQSEDDVIVVTANIRHLSQFVDARLWSEISFPQADLRVRPGA